MAAGCCAPLAATARQRRSPCAPAAPAPGTPPRPAWTPGHRSACSGARGAAGRPPLGGNSQNSAMVQPEITDYERERLRRLEENQRRMQELGLQQVRARALAAGGRQRSLPAPRRQPAAPRAPRPALPRASPCADGQGHGAQARRRAGAAAQAARAPRARRGAGADAAVRAVAGCCRWVLRSRARCLNPRAHRPPLPNTAPCATRAR